mmetsp:Transcript_63220/g.120578  ORF Transcript_63220/g.120578 Transcript_63220/m.120578 type:complete len:236 (-) Transcript_63220:327-1034(-)
MQNSKGAPRTARRSSKLLQYVNFHHQPMLGAHRHRTYRRRAMSTSIRMGALPIPSFHQKEISSGCLESAVLLHIINGPVLATCHSTLVRTNCSSANIGHQCPANVLIPMPSLTRVTQHKLQAQLILLAPSVLMQCYDQLCSISAEGCCQWVGEYSHYLCYCDPTRGYFWATPRRQIAAVTYCHRQRIFPCAFGRCGCGAEINHSNAVPRRFQRMTIVSLWPARPQRNVSSEFLDQ